MSREVECARCGTRRAVTEMAGATDDKGGFRYFCHPASSTGVTCYMDASYDGSLFGDVEGVPVSPVPWRIVRFDAYMADLDGMKQWCSIGAEAPPEVVPAVWTHEGCPDCGGTENIPDHGPECYAKGECVGGSGCPVPLPCPAPPRLVPWPGALSGEETP